MAEDMSVSFTLLHITSAVQRSVATKRCVACTEATYLYGNARHGLKPWHNTTTKGQCCASRRFGVQSA
jgi:hypothetical protein